MAKAEVAQGHNSAFVDDDGKAYVVYHTKFNDGTAGHEVRVHQLYVNSQGWLVASPYEYSGETISKTGYTTEEIAGTYGMITHDYQINFSKLAYKSPETITLNEDGTVTGAYTGTWSATKGSADAKIVLDGVTYYGMFTEEVIDGTTIKTMGFTFVSEEGLSIWGTKELGDSIAVAQTVSAGISVPSTAYTSFTLPTEGESGAKISWETSNADVLSASGEVTKPEKDTTVTLTGTVYKGDYYYEKDFEVLVSAADVSQGVTLAKYFTNEKKDISTGLDASIAMANPFYCGTTAVDLSGGVTIEFDAASTGGRVSIQTAPYICYNDANGNCMDINQPGSTNGSNMAIEAVPGEEYRVEILITNDGVKAAVNGEEVTLGLSGSGAGYDELLAFIGECDQLTWGVGLAETAYWNTELCTLTDMQFRAGAEVPEQFPVKVETEEWDGITTESVYEADGYKVTFNLNSQWTGGYNASVKIENTGDAEVENWILEAKTDCEIANIWNADIESDTDNHYVITNKGYNEKIALGESVTFGFNGENGTVDNVPAEYKVSAYILTK